jgi:glycosyltransferase involved in cell wall biosynthesis
MRIALVSTCAVAVPPKGYGGSELVVAELAKMLTRRGHDVTVFATGDSRPEARLAWRFAEPVWPPDEHAELRHAGFAWRHLVGHAGDYDVVHVHQAPSIVMSSLQRLPVVATIHHERDARLTAVYRDFQEVTYVAISKRQAALVPEVDVRHVVHHGVDPAMYPPGDGAGGYCAFLGRLAWQKGPHVAIDAAVEAGVPIRLGGAPHWEDADYFAREVRPRFVRHAGLASPLGEVGHAEKLDLLRGARALLFPIAWEEPFGLVMIEAMLVGTPVLAFARGSVPEVVEDGITGFVVRDAREMAARLRRLGGFDRARCRARALERWSSMRMARDYEGVYAAAIAASRGEPRRLVSGTMPSLGRTGTE